MQTRTYGDLFKLIQSLAGVSSFATTETDDIANLINRRYFEAYQTIQMWPRYLVESEERTLSSFLVSGYTDDDYNGLFYKYGDDANGNAVYVKTQKAANGNRVGVAYVKDNNKWFLAGGTYSRDVETGVVTFTGSVTINLQRDTDIVYENPWDVVWAQLSGGLPQVTERGSTMCSPVSSTSAKKSVSSSPPARSMCSAAKRATATWWRKRFGTRMRFPPP